MSLYEDLGGDPAVETALDHFYGKVMDDPRVNKYFTEVHLNELKDKQRTFLTMAFGGPNAYEGRDLRAAHASPRAKGLDEEGFEVFMAHFRATLEELGVGEDHVAEVMAIAYSGRDDVLNR